MPADLGDQGQQDQQPDGAAAIHWAVYYDDEQMVDMLLKAGAVVTVTNRDGATPLALASINLTARKPEKTTATGNAYLRKTVARHGLTPALAVAFAGRLDYQRYSWRDRQIIRFIMLLTGGPTDPGTQIEYTSWDAVDDFADRIAALRRQS